MKTKTTTTVTAPKGDGWGKAAAITQEEIEGKRKQRHIKIVYHGISCGILNTKSSS